MTTATNDQAAREMAERFFGLCKTYYGTQAIDMMTAEIANSRAALASRVLELEAIISATLANGGFMTNENIFVARAALKGGTT